MLTPKKIWLHVEKRLLDIENTGAYYAGGTLSLPLGTNKQNKPIGVCLNISGKGFVLSDLKNTTVYLPDHITSLVRELYLKYKGNTDHYQETVVKEMEHDHSICPTR